MTLTLRLGTIDDVNTVKRDVTQTPAVRHEVAEVHLAVRPADEYVPVNIQLPLTTNTIAIIIIRPSISIYSFKQEAQLMLTTRSTRLAVSRGRAE